jgi:hypothetical protein
MTPETAAGRVTEIISLLRPERPRRLPESLAAAAADDDIERSLIEDAAAATKTAKKKPRT